MNQLTRLVAIAAAASLPAFASAQLAGSGGQPANPNVPSASSQANDPSTAAHSDSATKYKQQGSTDSSTSSSTAHKSKARKSKSTSTSDSDSTSTPQTNMPGTGSSTTPTTGK